MDAIFLDVDGVLCTPLSMRLGRGRPVEKEPFDPISLFWLRWLVRRSGAVVVLSSSWRDGLTVDDPFCRAVIGHLFSVLARNGTPIEDVTPLSMDGDKGVEIASWLDCCPCQRYAVLDDHDCFSLRPAVRERWIPIPDSRGLRRREARAALRLLRAPVP